jgi:hypothetical protein
MARAKSKLEQADDTLSARSIMSQVTLHRPDGEELHLYCATLAEFLMANSVVQFTGLKAEVFHFGDDPGQVAAVAVGKRAT